MRDDDVNGRDDSTEPTERDVNVNVRNGKHDATASTLRSSDDASDQNSGINGHVYRSTNWQHHHLYKDVPHEASETTYRHPHSPPVKKQLT